MRYLLLITLTAITLMVSCDRTEGPRDATEISAPDVTTPGTKEAKATPRAVGPKSLRQIFAGADRKAAGEEIIKHLETAVVLEEDQKVAIKALVEQHNIAGMTNNKKARQTIKSMRQGMLKILTEEQVKAYVASRR